MKIENDSCCGFVRLSVFNGVDIVESVLVM